MAELTERYVGATLRSIPDKQRDDIEAELRASIDDAVEARVATGESAETAENDVLTDLGDPDRLAASYTGRPGFLIGPELFFDYKRLLTVLLLTVVPIVAVVIGVLEAIDGGSVGSVIGETIGLAITLAAHIGFWTTLVFAVMEWSGEKAPTGEWSLSRLPPLTPTSGGIKLGETIASMVFLVIAIVGLIVSRDLLGVASDDGSLIPLFDPATWDFWIPFLIMVLALEIIFEAVKYRVGRWTGWLASVNAALNVAFALPAIYLLATEQLLNPAFFEEIGWTGAHEWGGVAVTITVVTIAAVAVWDIVDGFRKAWTALRDPDGRDSIKAGAASLVSAVETTINDLSSELSESDNRKRPTSAREVGEEE